MKVVEFLEMSYLDLYDTDEKELRKIVNQMSFAANNRLRWMSNQDIKPHSFRSRQIGDTDEYRRFTSKGKDYNQLRHEAKYLKMVLDNKTGTKQGWEDFKDDMYQRMYNVTADEYRNSPEDYTPPLELQRIFWKVYNEIGEDLATRYLIMGSNGTNDEDQQNTVFETIREEFDGSQTVDDDTLIDYYRNKAVKALENAKSRRDQRDWSEFKSTEIPKELWGY